MPCTNCMVEFTRFRKEHGCSSCSFSFCAKCLPQKIVLPQLSKQPVSVCQDCYNKLTKNPTGILVKPNYHTSSNYVERGLRKQVAEVNRDAFHIRPVSQYKEIEERLEKLKSRDNSEQKPLSVDEIEERLAKLRGVSVEEIRSPSLLFMKSKNRTTKGAVEELIEETKAEVDIERKWATSEDKEEEPLDLFFRVNEIESIPSDATDIIFDDGILRNIKELKGTLISGETISRDVSSTYKQHEDAKNELERMVKLTKQNSIKNEKINAEMGKFWERNMEKFNSDDESLELADEIDDKDLKKILAEAEKAVDEEKKVLKESKKQKKSFFSKLFHSVD